jgi:hypothetical protein
VSRLDLVSLAREVAVEVGARVGVDGVFVFVYRKGDDSSGAAINASTVEINTMVAMIVQNLGAIRQQIVESALALEPRQ